MFSLGAAVARLAIVLVLDPVAASFFSQDARRPEALVGEATGLSRYRVRAEDGAEGI
jgi:hypothetical protein